MSEVRASQKTWLLAAPDRRSTQSLTHGGRNMSVSAGDLYFRTYENSREGKTGKDCFGQLWKAFETVYIF